MRCELLLKRAALIAGALVLGGCGGMPRNAEDFRQFALDRARVPGGVPKEAFEVERPFREVSATLENKADECLKVVVRWTATGSDGNTRFSVDTFKPTFIANAGKAELHVQLKRSAVVEAGAPSDGAYRVVLDATPVAPRRTRIEIYALSTDDKPLRQALRGWAQGGNLRCPDLTQR